MRDRNGNQVIFTRIGGGNGEVSKITSRTGDGSRSSTTRQTASSAARTTSGASSCTPMTRPDDWPRSPTSQARCASTYDAANRIVKIRDARGADYLTVAYDANGRVASQVTPAGSYAFGYTLDAGGKVTETRVTQPGGAVRRVTFDASGTLATDTEAYGSAVARTTTLERGPDRRVTAMVDPYGRRVTLGYDAAGHHMR
jgi:YD repeat-containing protein